MNPVDPHVFRHTASLTRRADNPNQQITRQEVLSLYTRQNGWFCARRHELRHDRARASSPDLWSSTATTSPCRRRLKKIRSVLTVVGGNVVHDAGCLTCAVMDAPFLLDEYRARLRALRRRRSLRAGENPYLELMTLLVGAPGLSRRSTSPSGAGS